MSSPSKVATSIVASSAADLSKRGTVTLIGIGVVPLLLLSLVGRKAPWISALRPLANNIPLELAARTLRALVWAPALSLSTAIGLAQLYPDRAAGRWRRGWQATPQVLVATVTASLVTSVPSTIAHVSSWSPVVRVAASLPVVVTALYLLVRTFVWIPAIVDQQTSASAGLRLSWSMTRKRGSLVLLLFAVGGIPIGAASVAAQGHPILLTALSCLTFPMVVLICCRAYCHILAEPKSS
jgi:hypothetical protein